MSSLLKKLEPAFLEIYEEALREVNNEKDLFNLQEYLDEKIQEIYYEDTEDSKRDFFSSFSLSKPEVERFMGVYNKYALIDNFRHLKRGDLVIMFDLRKQSVEKKINKLMTKLIYSMLERLAVELEQPIEEVRKMPDIEDKLYETAKELIESKPSNYMVRKPPMIILAVKPNHFLFKYIFMRHRIFSGSSNECVFFRKLTKHEKMVDSVVGH
jgi:hypothetical protein